MSTTPVIANNQSVTWPAGTCYFTSLTMGDGGSISFSGPATIYLDGNAIIHDNNTIAGYQKVPSSLKIYQSDWHIFTMNDHDSVWGIYYGPLSALAFHDNGNWYGAAVAGAYAAHDNNSFYTDKELMPSNNGIALIK